MLFQVTMDVRIPLDADPATIERLKASEKQRCADLMAAGTWRHIWRVAGRYRNVSIFDVADNGELHDILMGLPLFPYMAIEVTPLCRHPSSIRPDDR
ncbi:muconolactone Delta-isomerase [Sphingomonas naphthae]|uniref:Muconolactone Delta-isomerase n=1 Tax=Sphingomonas naphthae TaxID=1813468 RepID=A0ABY7TPH2_9SPHN|nr:muconolactone Delta-isomerase [Sphingomonas naphthae]WCT74532.1 muconolactone Delta-isomerase [Sphingomonas naphthae]